MGLFNKKKDNENFEKLKSDYDAILKERDNLLEENIAMRKKMDYVEELLDDCEKLQAEWIDRVQEAKQVRNEMMNLINALSKTMVENE